MLYLSVFLDKKRPTDFNRSTENFKKAIQYNPEDASAYNGLGGAFLIANNYEEAILNLKKALELRPDYAQALYNIGRAYIGIEDKENSRRVFLRYKQLYYHRLSETEKKKLDDLLTTISK